MSVIHIQASLKLLFLKKYPADPQVLAWFGEEISGLYLQGICQSSIFAPLRKGGTIEKR
ncbi:hypothetical protein DI53_1093 [Sphingobacterium deserti]|uniref:Uncharacterized protein n=1 Tax=Sphingobacterium deserti TaxID=1229276 RepID=A0A0B8TAG9_9SPHI|nr:hypothetical protein DI53_1093 [Sphingobacterium deserti]